MVRRVGNKHQWKRLRQGYNSKKQSVIFAKGYKKWR